MSSKPQPEPVLEESEENTVLSRVLRYSFSRRSCFRILCLLGLLGLQVVLFKTHKLWFLAHKDPQQGFWVALVPSLYRDFLVFFVLSYLGLFVLEWSRGVWRSLVLVGIHSFAFVGFFLATIEHRFFLVTNTLVDWELLRYGAVQFWMLSSMIWSQINPITVLLLLVPIGINLFPMWLERRQRLRAWLESEGGTGRWRTLEFALLLVFVVSGVRLLHDNELSNDVRPLQRNVFLRLGEGAWRSRHVQKPMVVPKDRKELLFDARDLRFLPTAKTRRMNVVLIVLESMRLRSTTLGNPALQTTPFLADLARKSLRTREMYPVVPHTSKALVSIFCGFYPKIQMEVVEAQKGGLPGRCLPHLLQDLGYQTAIFHPATLRFENYDILTQNIGFQHITGLENLNTRGFFRTNYFGYEDRVLLKPSLAWLDRAMHRNRPFFLAYHTLTAHHGYTTPPTFPRRRYVKSDDEELHDYHNALRYTDDFVKELFQEFKRRGLMKNTVFVLVADHGEAFGEHNRRQHDNGMWDEILQIPMLVYQPKLFPKGRIIEGLRQQIDILPTVADVLKLRIEHGHIPGRSLLKSVSKKRKVFLSCWYEKYCMAVREGKQKTIFNYDRRPTELFDLAKDRLEQRDLAKDPALFGLVQRHRAELLRWKKQVNLVYESPDPRKLARLVSRRKPKIERPRFVSFGGVVEFLGYELHTPDVTPGKPVEVTYFFRCKKPVPSGWELFFHMHQRGPKRYGNLEHIPVAGRYKLPLWKPGEFIRDRHRFFVPADYLPGATLELHVGMWSRKTGKRIVLGGKVFSPSVLKTRSFPFASLILRPPKDKGRPPVNILLDAHFRKVMRLVGYNLHTQPLEPGGWMDITFVFEVFRPIPKDWRLFFHLEQVKPFLFRNLDRSLLRAPASLVEWSPGMHTLRLRTKIASRFQRQKKVRVFLGVWSPGKPRQPIHGPKDSVKTDGERRLLVFEKTLGEL